MFVTLRTDREDIARAVLRLLGNFLDQTIMGDRAAKRLRPEEGAWFLVVPEGRPGETHYHGFIRLPRIKGRRKLLRNFLRFSDASLSRFLTNVFRWKFGKPAFVEFHVKRVGDRRFARMAGYVLKRRDAVERWADRVSRDDFRRCYAVQ